MAGVAGSTNNTFHVNGQPFANRTAAFDAGVLQAETLAQSAERGGLKVAQIEWAGGRGGEIQGPTVDFRTFLSGRGVATNYISPTDPPASPPRSGCSSTTRRASPASAVPAAARAGDGWIDAPVSYSPAQEMRMRVLDFGVDKYGLNAYLYDATDDGPRTTTACCSRPRRRAARRVGDIAEGEWADVGHVQGGAARRRTGAFLVKVERLAGDLSEVRLFHTSVTRAIATWPTWPGEPGFTGDFEDFVAERFPSSQAGDFAVLEAGIVSEETYVEQGVYWEPVPPADRVHPRRVPAGPGDGRLPRDRRVPAPVPRSRHRGAPQRRAEPCLRRRPGQRHARRPGRAARGLHPRAYEGADATMRLAQEHLDDPT